ncbi:MAG: BatA domain-containing protein [Candidatus Neomarinimicrobiota bacterium]
MTFFSPTALWGLFAVLIPILIHLFSLKNTREVEFSTIRFIKGMEKEKIRKLKIRQWLLIFLRMAAIAALVLMAARPVQKGFISGWMAAELESRVVILLDNSASMSMKSGSESLLEKAKKSIPLITSAFEGTTHLHIFQTNPPSEIYAGILSAGTSMEKIIESVTQSHSRDNLWFLVDSIMKIIPADEPNREFFIVSDFPSKPGPELLNDLKNIDFPWRFYFLGQAELQDNLAITDVSAISQIKLPKHLLKLNTKISNDGLGEKRYVPVELYINEERVGQIVSHFKPGRIKDFLFQVYPGKSGIIQGVLELPTDDFQLDNRRTFELSVPDQISVKLIGKSQDQNFLLRTALESISKDSEFLYINNMVMNEIRQVYLQDTDVLILHDPGVMSAAAVEDIKKFLVRGGGIIWFSGQNVRLGSAAAEIFELPAFINPVKLENEAFLTVNISNSDHPVLKDLNLGDLKSELPRVFQYNKVQKRSRQNYILSLDNGDPFLLEQNYFGGNIYWFSSPLDLSWNDLPMRGIMVPLLHRIIILLAADERNTTSVLVDEIKTIELSKDKIQSKWTLVTPSNKRILIVPEYSTETLKIRDTNEIGSYDIFADDEKYTSFSTQLSPFERPSLRADPEVIRSRWGQENSRWISPEDNLDTKLKEIRHGKSLWRYFLILSIILLGLETIIGRANPEELKNKAA